MAGVAARGPDILIRTAPPFAATSDAPLATTATPPVAASNDTADQAAGTPAEISPEVRAAATKARQDGTPTPDPAPPAPDDATAVAAEPDGDTTAADADAASDPDKAPDDTPPWMKREITKSRNRQRDAETRAAQAEEKAAQALRLVEELSAKLTPVQDNKPPADPKPTRDQFETPDAYDTALETWAVQQGEKRAAEAAQTRQRQDAEKAQRDAAEAQLASINATWNTRRDAAMEEMTDYAEVAEASDLNVSVPMAHAIMVAPNGPAVAYHLGKHRAEAERIFALPNAGQQIFEIGMLAAKLALPKPAAVSRAPQPIRPLAGSAAPADTTAREPSMEEWGTRRTAEIRGGRKPFLAATH